MLRTVQFRKLAGLLGILSPNTVVGLWAETHKEGEEPALWVVSSPGETCGKGFGSSSAEGKVLVNVHFRHITAVGKGSGLSLTVFQYLRQVLVCPIYTTCNVCGVLTPFLTAPRQVQHRLSAVL